MSLDPETLAQLLQTVRRFVRQRLVPNEARVADDDQRHRLPRGSSSPATPSNGRLVYDAVRHRRLFRLYEGTSQIQQLIIAREMLAAAP